MAEIAEELDRQAHAMMARDLGGSEGIAAIFGKAAAEDHDAKMAAAATVNRPDTPGTAMIAEAARVASEEQALRRPKQVLMERKLSELKVEAKPQAGSEAEKKSISKKIERNRLRTQPEQSERPRLRTSSAILGRRVRIKLRGRKTSVRSAS